jgi:hypothetical protein
MPTAITSLSDLAAQANENHQLAESTAGRALEFARLSGAALIEAKSQVSRGEWIAWLSANFGATRMTAHRYMKLADPNVTCMLQSEPKSINEALRMIAGEDEEEEDEDLDAVFEEALADARQSATPKSFADSLVSIPEPTPEPEDEPRAVAVEVVDEEDGEPEPPECEPEKGVGLVYARTALDALNKIPKRDPSRKPAIAMIRDWLEANQ